MIRRRKDKPGSQSPSVAKIFQSASAQVQLPLQPPPPPPPLGALQLGKCAGELLCVHSVVVQAKLRRRGLSTSFVSLTSPRETSGQYSSLPTCRALICRSCLGHATGVLEGRCSLTCGSSRPEAHETWTALPFPRPCAVQLRHGRPQEKNTQRAQYLLAKEPARVQIRNPWQYKVSVLSI